MFTIYDGRKSFYQWDVNQKIIVNDLNCEIHFKHVGSSNAIICKPYKFENKIVVNVPNILLQESGSIVFWVFVNGEYTMETGKFNVTSRQKPADYVFTELEHLEYRKLNERIDAIEGGSISDETVERAIEAYLDENPIEAGATAEEAAQIEQNRKDIAELKESGGTAGEDGATYTPHVSADGVISWTNDKGKENPDPVNIKGVKGDTGADGAKGADGADGAKGDDGFSPVVNVTPISGGHTVEITDANGTKTFNVMNGVNGSGGDGSGDMLMSVYDTNGNGVVDNAEKFDGKTVDYFAKAEHTHSEYAPAEHEHEEYAPAEHEHSEYLTEFTETDPTVPEWAKAASKPSYTASEVGLGNVENVKQYSASNPPPYPVTSVNGMTGDVVIESGGSGGTSTIETQKNILLWENPNKDSEFAAQTISLDLSECVGVYIVYKNQHNGTIVKSSGFLAIDGNRYYLYHGSMTAGTQSSRRVTVNAQGCAFEVGQSSTSSGATDNDSFIVPLEIYGVKKINQAIFGTAVTYGTDDLTAGTSELADGEVYLVYE